MHEDATPRAAGDFGPEGRPPTRRAARPWWIAVIAVASVLFAGLAVGAYLMGGLVLAGLIVALGVVVVALRGGPLLLAAALRTRDPRPGSGPPRVVRTGRGQESPDRTG